MQMNLLFLYSVFVLDYSDDLTLKVVSIVISVLLFVIIVGVVYLLLFGSRFRDIIEERRVLREDLKCGIISQEEYSEQMRMLKDERKSYDRERGKAIDEVSKGSIMAIILGWLAYPGSFALVFGLLVFVDKVTGGFLNDHLFISLIVFLAVWIPIVLFIHGRMDKK